MQEVDLTPFGFPNCKARDDGSIVLPNGRIIAEPYNSGQVKLPTINGTRFVSFSKVIATAFVPNPKNYRHVIHLDGNRWNNRPENLEWSPKKFRTTSPILEGKRAQIIQLYVAGYGKQRIERATGCTKAYIESIIEEFEEAVSSAPKFNE